MDRFRTIESFVRVAHSGSFTKAARQLGLSRALISRRIIELEARLGVRLLNRSTRSVSLTAEGRAYLSRCKQVLDDMEAAEREIARGAKTPLWRDSRACTKVIRRNVPIRRNYRVFQSTPTDPRFTFARRFQLSPSRLR